MIDGDAVAAFATPEQVTVSVCLPQTVSHAVARRGHHAVRHGEDVSPLLHVGDVGQADVGAFVGIEGHGIAKWVADAVSGNHVDERMAHAGSVCGWMGAFFSCLFFLPLFASRKEANFVTCEKARQELGCSMRSMEHAATFGNIHCL